MLRHVQMTCGGDLKALSFVADTRTYFSGEPFKKNSSSSCEEQGQGWPAAVNPGSGFMKIRSAPGAPRNFFRSVSCLIAQVLNPRAPPLLPTGLIPY